MEIISNMKYPSTFPFQTSDSNVDPNSTFKKSMSVQPHSTYGLKNMAVSASSIVSLALSDNKQLKDSSFYHLNAQAAGSTEFESGSLLSDDDEDEIKSKFWELRGQLRTLVEVIVNIDPDLVTRCFMKFIIAEKSDSEMFYDVELKIYLIAVYAEAFKGLYKLMCRMAFCSRNRRENIKVDKPWRNDSFTTEIYS